MWLMMSSSQFAYVVEEGVPQEKFVAFHECVSDVTGETISENTISNLAV